MMWCLFFASVAAFAANAAAPPAMPKEYTTVIQMKMPYIPLEMPLRVLTSATAQKIEYYDGLEVDTSNAQGTYKYSFNNSKRVCMFKPSSAGPKQQQGDALMNDAWEPSMFFPDLSQYTQEDDELVGGILCQKFSLNAHHGTTGTMDDHISFYWDPILGKPVRWHMHSRHVTFGSHTDEYIMDFLSFQEGAPSSLDLALPAECEKPQNAHVSIRIQGFLQAAHAARTPRSSESSPLLFAAFLRTYGKSYLPEEHIARNAVFSENMHMLQQLNQQHAGQATFKANQFLDMSKEEVMSFRGGKNKGPSQQRRSPDHLQYVRTHKSTGSAQIPKDFDWRTAKPGVLTPVKDQAMCGSCWAYGATEPIESIQAIQIGRLIELPEQFVVDCTWTNGTGDSGSNSGCDGGDSDIGVLEIVRKFGGVVPTAASYGSYLSVNGYCKDARLMDVGAKVTGWVDVPSRDEQALLEALVTKGPISVSIMVPDEMLFYDSGVLKVSTCKHNESQIDHAVVLVGYGTDEAGTDYYTIRNSWSTYWGDEGYIKIARGDWDCCVSSASGYPELDAAPMATIVV